MKMKESQDLKILSERLREIFMRVYNEIKHRKLTDRTLNAEVLNVLKRSEISEEGLEIKFSEPKDSIYRAESGRTPYDLLAFGKVNGKVFTIFINNKFGNIYGSTRNDITTYNNLLRLYLGISKQRLTSKIVVDGELIYRRIAGEEIVFYAVSWWIREREGLSFFY